MNDPLKMAQLHADLSRDLDRIRKRFVSGSKVTLVVRNPSAGVEAGIVIGNDDLHEAIEEIRRRQAQLDVCEHDVPNGDWCPACNRAYKQARKEMGEE